MSNRVPGPPTCPRCGHGRTQEDRTPAGGLGRTLRRWFGSGQERRMCQQPLDLGWRCRCRSRFHGDFGLPPALRAERPASDAATQARLAQQALRGLAAERRAEQVADDDAPGVG